MKVLISESRDQNSINYTLEDKEIFSNVEYKVLRNAETDGFIKCVKISHNGKLKLVYDISSYRDLLSLTREMSLNSFLTVVSKLLTIVINVGEKGLMQYKNINPSINNIYVDTTNLNVYMIYLPLQYEGNDSEDIFIREFKNNMIQAISLNRNFRGESATILRNNLISDKSLNDILKELNNKEKAEKVQKAPVNIVPENIAISNITPKQVEPQNIESKQVKPKQVESKPIESKRVEPKKVETKKVESKKIEGKNVEFTNELPTDFIRSMEMTSKVNPKKVVNVAEMSKKIVSDEVEDDIVGSMDTDSQIEERNKKKGKSLLGSLDKFLNKALESHAQMDVVENYYGDLENSIVEEMRANSKILSNSRIASNSKIISKPDEEKKSLSSISSISSVSNADETTTTFMKALSISNDSMQSFLKSVDNRNSSIISNAKPKMPEYKSESIQGDGSKALVLKRINTSVPLSFVISKKEYAIGSNKYMVDGIIDNKAVSRLHCIVTVKNDEYYIQDVDSKNGTFVNSIKLQKNVMTKINVGDKISIANCDFLVKEIEI
ncbi:FHA domain-containing protein [Clostridium sp. SHJSY1]|uniref:FHA domain-containing protein n=1 Tax=Clostridium sp. SHJSY1 TaxID=2942483 RepID=UPI0028742C2E|nr:FHA domain-containing protein [Clostridium sp. SHJSY1]MDS0524366.1 FHA domain-containing protein [Clostridium sp. SHJSY1]